MDSSGGMGWGSAFCPVAIWPISTAQPTASRRRAAGRRVAVVGVVLVWLGMGTPGMNKCCVTYVYYAQMQYKARFPCFPVVVWDGTFETDNATGRPSTLSWGRIKATLGP